MGILRTNNGRHRNEAACSEPVIQIVPRTARVWGLLAAGAITIGLGLLIVRLVMALIVAEDLRRKADAAKEGAIAETQRDREEIMAATQGRLEQAQRKEAAAERSQAETRTSVEAGEKKHDEDMARLRIEVEQAQELRAKAERKSADANKAALEAEQKRQEEIAARIRGEQERAEAMRRQHAEIQPSIPPSQVQPNQAPAQREASRLALRPAAVEKPLFWGMTYHGLLHGRRVEVWSNGPIAVAADNFGFELVPRTGHITRFPQPLETLHVRPLNPGATKVFIRPLVGHE